MDWSANLPWAILQSLRQFMDSWLRLWIHGSDYLISTRVRTRALSVSLTHTEQTNKQTHTLSMSACVFVRLSCKIEKKENNED